MGQLKKIEDIDFDNMTIHVVNETPGSRREITRDQIWPEIERLRGNPDQLHPLNPARRR